MAHTAKSVFYYSLLSALIMMPMDSYCAMRISNKSRSYADAYNQVNEMRAPTPAPTVSSAHSDDLGVAGQTENSDSTVELPIRVANQALASQIARGESTSVTVGQLEKCGSVYPNGNFAWDTPTAGARSGTGSQCVAVVEMRGYQMGPGGTDLLLGRVNVAAGDAIKCNAFAWPNSALLPAAETITFPNDTEPTVEDVIAVMDQEQKQNAGLKIAAGTLIAAVAGNALGANEVGSDSLLGTNKEKIQGTAIGGLTGAAIMAGNVYAGKVAGDMILSAGINATAGGLIGNMAASGDAVLKIENCTVDSVDKKCLWGVLLKSGTKTPGREHFYDIAEEEVYECDVTGPEYTNCAIFGKDTADIILDGYLNQKTANNEAYDLQKMASEGYVKVTASYKLDTVTKKLVHSGTKPNATGDNRFVKIADFTVVDSTVPAVLVGVKDKAFGWHKKDWTEFTEEHKSSSIMRRGTDGQPVALADDEEKRLATIDTFRPMYQDAEDGALIDLGNKARLKGTLIGAGAGGALGAFTAYQGAQDEIQQRWVSAVREYKDSLQKIYCATGTRFLTHYNDTVIIPNTSE